MQCRPLELFRYDQSLAYSTHTVLWRRYQSHNADELRCSKRQSYGFRLIGSNKDNICFYGKNNETNFVLYNVTDLRFKNGDYKILYGQNNSFVRLRAEYA